MRRTPSQTDRISSKVLRLILVSLCLAVFAAAITLLPDALFGVSAARATSASSESELSESLKKLAPGVPAPAKASSALPTGQKSSSVRDGDDDPDLPSFLEGTVDGGEYLRQRAEQIALMRGYEPGQPFDPTARPRALEMMEAQFARNAPLINPTTWTPIGPVPIPNGQTSPSVPVSGRVTAIDIHPTNPNMAYVGTAQGGVYRTLDGGTTWTPLMDAAQSLAIGAVAINPFNPSTVFVGTGEGNLSLDSFFGVGLYRIINADTTATLEGPFESRTNGGGGHAFIGTAITKIVVDPANGNNIFVGNTLGGSGLSGDGTCCGGTAPPSAFIGLYLSTNALAATPTFVRVNPASLPGGGVAAVTDMAMEPGNANTLVIGQEDFGAGALNSGIFRSTNALLGLTSTWTKTLDFAGTQRNIEFAINKVGATVTVLAATEESSGTLRKSTDGGQTWPTTLSAVTGFCDGQCSYDIIVGIDPANASIIYIGGNVESGSQRLFAKSTNGGTTFTNSSASLHADQHAIAIAPSNTSIIYDGNDGGIWKSTNAGGTWTSLNNTTFNATQFESIALHPSDQFFTIGGTQDNGTEFQKPDDTWTRADFGDGGFALIDQNAANTTAVTMYHTYFNLTSMLIGFARVTSTTCATDGEWVFRGFGGTNPTVGCEGVPRGAANGLLGTDNVLFYAPMALGPGNPNTLYFGTDRLYRSINRGDTMVLASQAPIVSGARVSAIGIAPQTDNVRIVGLTNGGLFFTTSASATLTNLDPTNAIPDKYVARTIIDPANQNTAYITLDGYTGGTTAALSHVWKATNLSTTPALIAINGAGGANVLPDIPVNAIAVDANDPTLPGVSVLYVGTDIGVYRSIDGGTNWLPFGTGLPRVAVFDIAIQQAHRFLRIATHGRGMWEISLGAAGTDTAGLYNPAGAAFFLRNSNSGGTADITFTYGPAGMGFIPLVGDWNGDGVDTIGLYNPATAAFFLRNSNTGGIADITFTYGPAGMGFIPIVGDWDGDGIDTIGLYDPTNAAFFLRNSNTGGIADITFTYGPAGMGFVPVVGDWNGDGVDTIGLYNPAGAAFFLRNSNTGGIADITFTYGPAGMGFVALVGDWNADGVDTIGLYNPAGAAFFLRNSNTGGIANITFTYGPAGMGFKPLVGDWDGL